MKRLIPSLPRSRSNARRISANTEDASGRRSLLREAPFKCRAVRQQIRHASTQGSRPRTALFFPGMRIDPLKRANADPTQAKESRK